MKINYFRFRNFCSYGNTWQEFRLDGEHGYNLVSGISGSGKSSINAAIQFGLYGQIQGRVLSDLPNRVNQELEVEIDLTSSGKHIHIRRGIKPAIFEVVVDGDPDFDKKSTKAAVQASLEELYGIPSYIFNNIISLSINDFKSFIKMNPSDKRKIIDKIFGLNVINNMRELSKGETKAIEQRRVIIGSKIESLLEQISQTEYELENLEETVTADIKRQKKELKTEAKKLKNIKIEAETKYLESVEKLDEAEVKIPPLKKKLKRATKAADKFHQGAISHTELGEQISEKLRERDSKVSKANDDTMELRHDLLQLTRDKQAEQKSLKFYENDQCPTCGGDLHEGFHLTDQKKIVDAIDILDKSIADIKKVIEISELKKTEINDEYIPIQEEMKVFKEDSTTLLEDSKKLIHIKDNHQQTLWAAAELVEKLKSLSRIVQNKIDAVTTKGKAVVKQFKSLDATEYLEKQTASLKNLIYNNNESVNKLKNDRDSLEEELYFNQLMDDMLSEGGVKKLAMDAIIPSLNYNIYQMIKALEFPYVIKFDNEFKGTIEHLGQEISAATLSTGETKKLDTAILIPIVKLMKMKFPGLNILFLDEIFSNLDMESQNNMVNIVRDLSEELKLHIFVVNHSPLEANIFDNIWEVDNSSGFSQITKKIT